jgi:SAM-dependent methyltransferase
MNPTGRFSNRVQDYVKYRPSYPAALVEHLRNTGALRAGSIVADVGSGTGLLTELFLKAGNQVIGVEPNAEMRAAGEEFLRAYPNFQSTSGQAEQTGLPPASVDLVAAGQAFHWFDRDRTKAEFRRILRPGGHVALIWNERVVERSPFLQAYEDLLHRYSEDYKDVDHRRRITDDVINAFFAPQPATFAMFPNNQVFDLAGLKGRLLSSSYAPPPGHPNHAPMLADLDQLFAAAQQNGKVDFEYETKLYLGTL